MLLRYTINIYQNQKMNDHKNIAENVLLPIERRLIKLNECDFLCLMC